MVSYDRTREEVQEYYSRVLKSSKDLQTNACCTADALPSYLRETLKEIHPEVVDRFYGCGSPFPEAIEGHTVLDLGSGTGRDCFLLSKFVGPKGRVVGVDMTPGQLETAQKHIDYHREKFGYRNPNVEFHQGYIEDLESVGIKSDSVDVVISNCVINLSPDKKRVFSEIFRVLKPGGELYFSDVFSDRRVPAEIACDPVALGECLGGALYIEDFRRMLAQMGCLDYRIVSRSPITIGNPELQNKLGPINFYSFTVRAFKLEHEDRCEDYGQSVVYRGTIPTSPHRFILDDHHVFEKGRAVLVCGNTAQMLGETRYREHFNVNGDRKSHYGLFECGPTPQSKEELSGACC